MSIPDRKFMSEFAVSLCSARWLIVTPSQLASNDKITDETAIEISKNCHIYLICKRPSSFFDPATFNFDGQFVTGNLNYRIKGSLIQVPFKMPFRLTEDAVKVELGAYHIVNLNA